MKVEVRFRGLDGSESLRAHILRRIHGHLRRFAAEVSSIVVRVADLNGPKGGIDKRCQVHVRGPRIGDAVIDERHADAYAAVDGAAERTGRAVGQKLGRSRS